MRNSDDPSGKTEPILMIKITDDLFATNSRCHRTANDVRTACGEGPKSMVVLNFAFGSA